MVYGSQYPSVSIYGCSSKSSCVYAIYSFVVCVTKIMQLWERQKKCLHHFVPLLSFISIVSPSITAEVVSASVTTAATWEAGEQHFIMINLPNSVAGVGHTQTRKQKHTNQRAHTDRHAEAWKCTHGSDTGCMNTFSHNVFIRRWQWKNVIFTAFDCVCMCSADTLMLLL